MPVALRDRFAGLPLIVPKRPLSVVDPRANTVACLIATKRALYELRAGRLVRLLNGECYGLSRRAADWFVYQSHGQGGRLLRFRRARLPVTHAHPLDIQLPAGGHQIDFVGDRLYLTDTYNNRLCVLGVSGDRAEVIRATYPAGTLLNGRSSANYVHMNSIWRGPTGTLAMFHNETRKTGRCSEIAKLDAQGRLLARTATGASHAHNILEMRGKPLYCDSQAGALIWGQQTVFQCDLFTRGLSVTPTHILVGGSAYGQRDRRERLGGRLYVLNHDFELLCSIPIPGMVQEIRSLGPDLALSNG